MGWNRNAEKVISAALALERVRRLRPWTAADLIEYLDDEEGQAKPSDATVYRLLHRFHEELGLLTSVADDAEDMRTPGRPRRSYELSDAGLEAADSAARWLAHGGVSWARVIVSGGGV